MQIPRFIKKRSYRDLEKPVFNSKSFNPTTIIHYITENEKISHP